MLNVRRVDRQGIAENAGQLDMRGFRLTRPVAIWGT